MRVKRAIQRRTTPRSLRSNEWPTARKIERVLQRKEDQRHIFADRGMTRSRGYPDMENIFHYAKVAEPDACIAAILRRKSKCVITELGRGDGGLSRTLQNHIRRNKSTLSPLDLKRIILYGFDLVSPKVDVFAQKPMQGSLFAYHDRVGDMLLKPFVKSDLVYSAWTIGYVGHVGFLVRKVARSLNAGGLAVLHVNRTAHHRMDSQVIQNMTRLAQNIRGITLGENYTLRVQRYPAKGKMNQRIDPPIVGDLLIIIQRKLKK